MPYKLAIFDFDGTLADSFPWFVEIFDLVADRYRFKRLDRSSLDRLRGLSARELIALCGVPAWKLPFIAAHVRRLAAREAQRIPLFNGAGEMLEALRAAEVATAIVTSNSEANVRTILGPRLSVLVDHYACGASMFGKASKLREALRASGVAAREAICIGDELRDIDAAEAEGIAFGAVGWGYTDLAALAARRPAEVFAQMADIATRLAAGPRGARMDPT